jgi:hypothetical protein
MEDGGVDTTVIVGSTRWAKCQTLLLFQLLKFFTYNNVIYLE